MKKSIIKIVILLIIALAIILTICGVNGLLTEKIETIQVVRVLCDAFFAAGIVFLGISGLVWAAEKGAFDGLGYSVSTMINTHMPTSKSLNWRKKETYEEYIARKHAPEKKKKLKASFIMGAIMLVVAIVFFVIYTTM